MLFLAVVGIVGVGEVGFDSGIGLGFGIVVWVPVGH